MEMSGNSCDNALHTAPIVSDLLPLLGGSSAGPAGTAPDAPPSPGIEASSATEAPLPRQVGELVLADLQLVAVLEAVRVDPTAVHVGSVERSRVVQVPRVGSAHQHRVVARDGDVVEEDLRLRRAPDRQPLAGERELLADAAAARADDERAAFGRHVADVDRPHLA